MHTDLRSFIDRVRAERKADFLEIQREVDPRYETTAFIVKLEEKMKSPLLLFKKLKGSRFPLVTNVCGSMGRLAFALNCPLHQVTDRYAEGSEKPIQPEVLKNGPVQENALRDAEIDLGILPRLIYHEGDSENPYITGAIVVARDPTTQKTNLSFHRLMIAGKAHTGIFMERGKHLDGIYKKYVELGRAMPIAAFIGVHPLVSLGALYSGSPDVEEYDVVGGLMRTPLDLVECLTQPNLFVPARAEMVLEGLVPVDERMDEGPFGEFTGYGTGVTQTPVFHVTALTFRNDCIYQDVISGHMEHLILPLPAIERRVLSDARTASNGVTRVSLVAPLTAIVALEKSDDAEPLAVIEALLRGDIYTKHVIVVDADVKISDLRQVVAAMALNTQANANVYVFPDEQGTLLDPSCTSHQGRVAKMGIDATRRLVKTRLISKNTVPEAVLDRIDPAELSNQ